ncbi:L-histidine N(alpha)-methyltransferase [Oleiagrimonas sp. MCCC 1A03011]|uniref:L-histidine N(alpha)-methyltransferase n=1 Tax=Oleiagrimonas sp. MCCC 1A03011 TaxID=1926883 RepID=UPI000DC2C75C|nr:L-histidine N(alpha)-methyltransferase [Oleiagrimonas sp. MCCC 1A03011]RAP57374.1 L-histidine N(alpha)-methyltransferase [Oleiagrimonas sp. MCCC 1A03011]
MTSAALDVQLHDLQPSADDMLGDVLEGLSRQPKQLSSKYFYDARGSRLFERICEQPEYYLTRAELALMREHLSQIADALGPEVLLVEYGSGSGIKTRLLLEHLHAPVAYMPVEISRSALMASVERLADDHPSIQMLPVCADFTQPIELPIPDRKQRRTVIYFPGSTIGNFEASQAVRLLRQMREEMGENGAALVGVDLLKDPAIIESAYNDAAGVTAAFTLNMLVHINRELGADFDVDGFAHRARFNPQTERIETHIDSLRKQDVHIEGRAFHFDAGESILVEYSCKYSRESFARLVGEAGLRVERVWTDPDELFSLQYLVAA